MIYDLRRRALELRERIRASMTPEELAQAGDDSTYTLDVAREMEAEESANEKNKTAIPKYN